VFQNPKISSQDLLASLLTVGVKLHASTISKPFHKFDLQGRRGSKKAFALAH